MTAGNRGKASLLRAVMVVLPRCGVAAEVVFLLP